MADLPGKYTVTFDSKLTTTELEQAKLLPHYLAIMGPTKRIEKVVVIPEWFPKGSTTASENHPVFSIRVNPRDRLHLECIWEVNCPELQIY